MTPAEHLAWGLGQQTGSCLLWPFALSEGYGAVTKRRITERTHVIACIAEHGARPSPEHQAAHTCGNHACFNRRHVRWVTQSQNENDKVAHGRSNHGERNGMSRLTTNDVLLIRERLRSGDSQSKIAAEFGISTVAVCNINTRKRWGHV